MKKIFVFVGLILSSIAASAQFPTTDSLVKYVNRWIRNSAVEAFQNLRLNTAMIGMTKFIDSAYGGQIASISSTNDSTFQIITLGQDTLTTVVVGRHWTLQQVLANGSTLTTNHTISIADSITFASGKVLVDQLRITGLVAQSDTIAYKPLARDALGNVVGLDRWPGGSGGSQPDAKADNATKGIAAFEKQDFNDNGSGIISQDRPSFYGTLYNQTTWANLNDFTSNGGTYSISSGSIAASASSPGTLNESLDFDSVSCLEYWRQTVRFKVNSTQSGTTHGIGIGLRSVNAVTPINIAAYVDLSTDAEFGNHLVIKTNYPADSFLVSSPGTLSYSNGDSLEYYFERVNAQFIFTARNITTASTPITVTYTYPTYYQSPTPPIIPNTGKFAIYALGGNYLIDSLSIFSREIKRADLMVIGDSKTVGYYGEFSNSPPNLLRTNFRNVVTAAGGGDRSAEILASVNEKIALNPKQVLIEAGTNDGVDSNTFKTNYQTFVTALTTAGIPVYHTTYYQPGNLWRHNWLRTTYPTTYIDAYTATSQEGALSPDDLHLSDYGDSLAFNAIIASNKLTYGQAYNNVTAGASGGNQDLDEVLAEGSSSSRAMNITGYSLTTDKFRVGNIGFQPYNNNNSFIFGNGYFDGANIKYIDNGYISGFQFADGQTLFTGAASGTAGANATFGYGFKTDYNGTVAIGGNISGTLNNFTGAKLVVNGSSGDATFNGVIVQPAHSMTRPSAQFASTMIQSIADANSLMIENGYFDGTDIRYLTTNPITYVQHLAGDVVLGTAVSGTAGAVATGLSRLTVKNNGRVGIGTSSPSALLEVNGHSSFLDTAALTARFSYNTNLGSSFTRYSLVDKNYVDSSVAAGGGGNTIYTADDAITGNRIVTADNNDLTFLTLDQLRFNMNTMVQAKNDGTIPYTSTIAGTGNIWKMAYTPVAGTYSKGDGLQIDTNNNVIIGAGTNAPFAPLYGTGNSLFANGIQNNGGTYYHIGTAITSLTLGLDNHIVLINATSGNITITLPAASAVQSGGVGIEYKFKRMDNSGNTITIQRGGSDTIDGGTSFTLTAQYEVKSVMAVSNTAWALF